jgi:DedD protein
VLALLAVVFVPMLLDPEPRQQRVEPVLVIPQKEGAAPLAPASPPPASVPVPAKPAEKGAGAEPAAPKTVAVQPAVPEARKTAEPKASEFKAPASRPATPPVAAKKVEAVPPRLEGFAVQVGAFREEEKLAQARDKLSGARISHYTERLQTPAGDLTRLRAGPYPTREAAERAAADMKRAGIDGKVVPLP